MYVSSKNEIFTSNLEEKIPDENLTAFSNNSLAVYTYPSIRCVDGSRNSKKLIHVCVDSSSH